jgi:hypothetical protein
VGPASEEGAKAWRDPCRLRWRVNLRVPDQMKPQERSRADIPKREMARIVAFAKYSQWARLPRGWSFLPRFEADAKPTPATH